MAARFFTQVVEGFGPEPKLLFALVHPGVDSSAASFEYMSLAEPRHIVAYPMEYSQYLESITPPPEPQPEPEPQP